MQLVQLRTQSLGVLFLETTIIPPYAADMLCVFFPSHPIKYQQDMHLGWDLIK